MIATFFILTKEPKEVMDSKMMPCFLKYETPNHHERDFFNATVNELT